MPNSKTSAKVLLLPMNVCLFSKLLQKNKTPGSDGLTAEFYLCFWNDVVGPSIDCYNDAYQKGEMSISQRRGVISLIPKKNKDNLLLKNWRPISLLNTDYKIATKCIANRLEKVLPTLINNKPDCKPDCTKFYVLNHVLIIAKYHIFQAWLDNSPPSFEMFHLVFKDKILCESRIAFKNNTLSKFRSKWTTLCALAPQNVST